MFRKVNTLRGEAAFGSWLYKVTTNAIMMHFRGAARRCHWLIFRSRTPSVAYNAAAAVILGPSYGSH